jgi:Fe-S oxidoreductase
VHGAYLIGSLEFSIPCLAKVPSLYNGLMEARYIKRRLAEKVGMVDSPQLSRFNFQAVLDCWNVEPATPERLAALSTVQIQKSVVIVQDAFTRYFETPLLASFIELASRIGFQVFLTPYSPNGKPLHVKGFLAAFNMAAIRNARQLQALSESGVRLVGLDPAMTLVYRQEYAKVLGLALLDCLTEAPVRKMPRTFRLLAHCTEKTNVPASSKQWVKYFAG